MLVNLPSVLRLLFLSRPSLVQIEPPCVVLVAQCRTRRVEFGRDAQNKRAPSTYDSSSPFELPFYVTDDSDFMSSCPVTLHVVQRSSFET
ncbi:hypothetical protein K443DRAFT_283679 [Laccaria amethystina LaAM-08-1]|uniref:Secreted protein n=1 Tax=Laccaria amethystina LaAM-08-1 TaxID=1095629 RepID=A0A0C9WKP7_9AGAR|nr:hypothetical protein K443DRAFT_283679 [Laccaria amethystina LaAM-08-1]